MQPIEKICSTLTEKSYIMYEMSLDIRKCIPESAGYIMLMRPEVS